LGRYSRARTLHFKSISILLLLLILACGPKPELRITTDGSSGSVWEAFLRRIPETDSVAIKGSLKIESSKTYEFGFEAFYINPDTLNFTAKGPLGIGWAKVVLLGDSGYFVNSKEKTVTWFGKNDQIFLGNTESQVTIPEILRALFLNRPESDGSLVEQQNNAYQFLCGSDVDKIDLLIGRENCLPKQQIISSANKSFEAKYSDWKMVNKFRVYPTKIIMESSSLNGCLRLKIDQFKPNAKIPRFLFCNSAESKF
jgi:hypothetical protein